MEIAVGDRITIKSGLNFSNLSEICPTCFMEIGWARGMEDYAGGDFTVCWVSQTPLTCGAYFFEVERNGYTWTTHWLEPHLDLSNPDWRV